jgi:hypothetical protein
MQFSFDIGLARGRMMKNSLFVLALCFVLTSTNFAAEADTTESRSPDQKSSAAILRKLEDLQNAIDSQNRKIQQLEDRLQDREGKIQQLEQQVSGMAVPTSGIATRNVTTVTSAVAPSIVTPRPQPAVLTTTNTSVAASQVTTKPASAESGGPLAIHFKGVTLTPGGFLEAAGIYRTHNENGDITSTFGNIPFSGSANSQLSEFRGTARQSRMTLLVEGKIKDWKASGYYEADFLGAAPTANEIESTSFNLRQRQLWAQVEFPSGFSFLGGQSWSLITTNRKGIAPLKEMIPLTIDSQYVIGYNWMRQFGFRFTKKFGDKTWLSFAAENPETTLGVINPPAGVFGFNTSPNAQSPSSQFTLSNTPGANGISTDVAPDLIAKVAFEPGWGHYEIKALGRFFRDRIGGSNNYTGGGGGGFGMVLPASKKLDVIVEGLAGVGIGRYADSVGPDVTLRPDGSIVPIRGAHVLAGLEVHPNPMWDFYIYGGDEYYDRASYVNASGQGVGYGSPLANNSGCAVESPTATQLCQAQTRTIWQIQPGFWRRFYKGPAGTVQFGMSYSYTYRNTWAGANSLQPKAIENMILTSFRYYLP